MKKEKIKKLDILINLKTGFCGYVISIGRFITLKSLAGEELTFDADFLEPAPSETAASFDGKIVDTEDISKIDPESSRKERTPEEIRAGLEKFIADIDSEHPAAAPHFQTFWKELLEIVGDKPGKTWDMRWGSEDHFCPILKAPSNRTNNWINWVYLLCGENVRIEMRKEYLPEEALHLYPLPNKMRGTTHAVKMDWKTFNAGPRAQHLELIKAISDRWRNK